jgi:hypothetical protein
MPQGEKLCASLSQFESAINSQSLSSWGGKKQSWSRRFRRPSKRHCHFKALACGTSIQSIEINVAIETVLVLRSLNIFFLTTQCLDNILCTLARATLANHHCFKSKPRGKFDVIFFVLSHSSFLAHDIFSLRIIEKHTCSVQSTKLSRKKG